MNRTERLYAVAEELRRAGASGTTGPRLARLLEVSERTIKRDVSALQQAGLPIWAQAGPGGGYVLDAVASLPPVNFTPAQAVAVAVALAALPAGSPFSADGAAARGKVFDALGPADRARAQDLAGRVWIDHGGGAASARGNGVGHGGGTGDSAGTGDRTGTEAVAASPAVLRAVEESLGRRLVLAIRYRAGDGAVTHRRIEPVLLAHMHGRWYVAAWSPERDAVRWFRLARIERADLTRDRYVARPVDVVGEPPPGAAPATRP